MQPKQDQKKISWSQLWFLRDFKASLVVSLLAEVAHQFQYAVRVIGSNYAPTIERDEFLVSEKIKKECKYYPPQ